MPEVSVKQKAMLMVFGPIILMLVIIFGPICYIIYKSKKLFENYIERFFTKFSELASSQNTLEYNKYLEDKEAIELGSHSDFHRIKKTKFLNHLLGEMGNVMVPKEYLCGTCAIAIMNYNELRNTIIHPDFLKNAHDSLKKIYKMCNEAELEKILSTSKDLIARHENILNYSPRDLIEMLRFMNLQFLYLYFLEDPEIAINLNAQDFYAFKDIPYECPDSLLVIFSS